MEIISIILSLLFSFYSAACDIKYRKISNRSLIIMGVLSLTFLFLREGIKKGTLYIFCLLPIWVFLFLLFVFKVTGAADIKLLYVLSLLIGRKEIIEVFILSLVVSLLIGIIYLIKGKKTMPFAVAIFIGMVVYCYGKFACHL